MAYVIAKCDKNKNKQLVFYCGTISGDFFSKVKVYWGEIQKAKVYKDRDKAKFIADMIPDDDTLYVIDIDIGDIGDDHGKKG